MWGTGLKSVAWTLSLGAQMQVSTCHAVGAAPRVQEMLLNGRRLPAHR
jgi:hypothetical protein